jgi:hypothetical protein
MRNDYINELYQLIKMGAPNEKIADWIAINGLRHSNQIVRKTFKKAGREDLSNLFIKEEDIDVGDTIKSRMTARIGKVVGIRSDGDTIVVRWETGGVQLLSKESVFKLRTKEIDSVEDITKVHSVLDPYGDIDR